MTEQPQVGPRTSWPMALGLIVVAFVLQTGFQTLSLIESHFTLERVAASQAPSLRQSIETRNQIQFLASGISRLAAAGNPNAIAVVQAMRKRGIDLHPSNAPATPHA